MNIGFILFDFIRNLGINPLTPIVAVIEGLNDRRRNLGERIGMGISTNVEEHNVYVAGRRRAEFLRQLEEYSFKLRAHIALRFRLAYLDLNFDQSPSSRRVSPAH